MTTKAYLTQIERLDRMIQNKLFEMVQIRAMATSVSSIPKEINVQSSPDVDKIGNYVAKIIELENETGLLVDEFVEKRKKIVSQIDKIDDTNLYHILSERYIARKELSVIAIEMGYSFKQLCRLHGNALIEFERVYGKEYLES